MFADFQSHFYAMFFAAITLLAVLNPFGNLTQFLSMTEDMVLTTRKKLFRIILYTALTIVMTFLFTGPFMMKYIFNIGLDDLRIAGGLILMVMATKNLLLSSEAHKSKQDFSQYQNLSENEILRKSIIPMAFPMLVGPGALSTVIVVSEDSGMLIGFGCVCFAFAFMFILFHFAATIERIVGKLILHIFSRIAQVFIMAIGVKMLIVGIKDIFILA
ncbi:MarC family protein [Campylobacter sp. MIT 99-7217]|uniref:MarC family protein n=1 Tax=Campylobacter sp. MIT 99-7217 TaxID=535091 RepID=UPI00115A609D|nr:MarC family protein [Campylobacter sp. MIT 99-7217]TQR33781.1 MarC family protein [Campylobacter sp. MIT 99-7217]